MGKKRYIRTYLQQDGKDLTVEVKPVLRSMCNTFANGKRKGYAMDAYYYDDEDYDYDYYDDNDYDPIEDSYIYGGNNGRSPKKKNDFDGCFGCFSWVGVFFVLWIIATILKQCQT